MDYHPQESIKRGIAMKKLVIVAALLFIPALAPALSAQVVDTTVCDVLADPESFDGKMIRVKGEVLASFEEFIIKGRDCNNPVNAIWLAYPEGTRGKAGPAALLQMQLSRNNSATPHPSSQPPLKMERNKDFNDFDTMLSTPAKTKVICLGCERFAMTATLVGRLDGSKDVGVVRDASGKFVAVQGFGNLNQFHARLVLESVTDLNPRDVDYSKAGATKDDSQYAPTGETPMTAAHDIAKSLGTGPAADQVERAAAAFGKEGDDNGVEVGFGASNEASRKSEGKGEKNSPDGLLFNVTLNTDRLKGDALSMAIAHVGTHIADIRDANAAYSAANLYDLEYRAWQTTVLSAIGSKHKALIMPGGDLVWNASWAAADRNKMIEAAIADYLTQWTGLTNSPQK
jgi:hypothetical protein